MTDKVRTIRLYGKLGNKFGRVHRLVVKTSSEAIRALSVTVPGFKKELMTSCERGISYAVFVGKTNISQEELHNPTGDDDIRIAPILQGNKRGGFFQTVLGVALVAVGMTTGIPLLTNIGLSLALGGAIQMLSPQQKGLSSKDGPNNGASYNFNGPINTTAQGNAVPIVYGRCWIGGATISAGIYPEDKN